VCVFAYGYVFISARTRMRACVHATRS